MRKSRIGRRRRSQGVLAALGTGGLILATAGTEAAPLDTNLVVNAGFESVDITSSGGGYNAVRILDWAGTAGFAYSHDGSLNSAGMPVPDYANGGPLAGGGHWYFTSNASTPDVTAPGQFFQDIDVSTGPSAATIAAGLGQYNLAAFMSSYLNHADFGNVHADFLDAAGASLGSALISDSDTSTWSLNSGSGPIPSGTTTVRLSVFGTPLSGGPDGYIDNVSFSVALVPEPSIVALAGLGLCAAIVRPVRRLRVCKPSP